MKHLDVPLNKDLTVVDVIKLAFKLGTIDSVSNVAIPLRKCINQSFAKSNKIPQQLSPVYMQILDDVLLQESRKVSKNSDI